MNGYQITFFTVQGHRHKGKPVGDWLMQLAKENQLRGATVTAANEGFGHHRRIHSAHFFEVLDQPIEIMIVATEEEADRLFALLKDERIHLFYVKSPVEFGTLGEPQAE